MFLLVRDAHFLAASLFDLEAAFHEKSPGHDHKLSTLEHWMEHWDTWVTTTTKHDSFINSLIYSTKWRAVCTVSQHIESLPNSLVKNEATKPGRGEPTGILSKVYLIAFLQDMDLVSDYLWEHTGWQDLSNNSIEWYF